MATAAAANESRSDLLTWINDLLQLGLTKIETVGTGAVLCQIMDSIYGRRPETDTVLLLIAAARRCADAQGQV